ncbi:MAG: hypothetical protein WC634_01020 [archaeon]
MRRYKRIFPGNTVKQRRAARKAAWGPSVFDALGGRARGVTPKSASRYTVKGRGIKTEPILGEMNTVIPAHYEASRWGGRIWVPERVDYREGQVGKRIVGEKLQLKRLSKKSGSGDTSARGTGPVRYGTAKAVKSRKRLSRKIGGKKGRRPGKEPKKRPKKKGA